MTSEPRPLDPADSVLQQYRMLHDIYVLLDDGDRRVLEDFDLTTSQYGVLLLLALDEGTRLAAVSDRLLVARSTITRIVDTLEAAGLVRRVADPHDRRAQRVRLTPEGAARRAAAQEAHLRSLNRRLWVFEDAERDLFLSLLHKLRSELETDLAARNHNHRQPASQSKTRQRR